MMEQGEGALRAYRDATLAYEAAQAEAGTVLKIIEAANKGFDIYLAAMLTEVFGLGQAPKHLRLPPAYKFDLTDWPDAERLRHVLTQWHDAFTRLEESWARIAPEDRKIAKPPVDSMRRP